MKMKALAVNSNVADLMPNLMHALEQVLGCGCETCRMKVLLILHVASPGEVPEGVAMVLRANDPRVLPPAGEMN